MDNNFNQNPFSSTGNNPFGSSGNNINQNPFGSSDNNINQNPFGSSDNNVNQNPFGSSNNNVNQNPFGSSNNNVGQNPFSSANSSSTQDNSSNSGSNKNNSVYLKKATVNTDDLPPYDYAANGFVNPNNQGYNNNFSQSYVEQPVPIPLYMPGQDMNSVVTIGDWLKSLLLCSIPCVGFILMIVFACSDENLSRRNFFRALLILEGIMVVLVILVSLLVFALGFSLYL